MFRFHYLASGFWLCSGIVIFFASQPLIGVFMIGLVFINIILGELSYRDKYQGGVQND